MTQDGILPAGGPQGLHDYLDAHRSVEAESVLDWSFRHHAANAASALAEKEGALARRPLVSARHANPEQTAGYTRTRRDQLRGVADGLDY